MQLIVINKRTIYILLGAILAMIFALIFVNRVNDVVGTTVPINNKVIVIDPGHGGVDPGALSNTGILEKDISLNISKKLRRLLEQTGSIVILTREEDVGLYTEKSKTYNEKKNEDLRNRRIMVNKIKPDLFLTIHLNSFSQSRYYGAQTFYQRGSDEGKKLSKFIQEELRRTLNNNNNRIELARDSVYLLREIDSTAILIECGFLSNPREAELLNQPQYQEKIAWAIYTGIIRYYNQIEKDSFIQEWNLI